MASKQRTTLIVVVAILVLVGAYYGVRVWMDREDTGGPREPIPQPVGPLPPITMGEHDWPHWGGPTHDNRSSLTGIRTDWGGGLKKVWAIHFLCQGARSSTWSAPVVRGNRLVTMGREGGKDLVFCLDSQTGKLLWLQSYAAAAGKEQGPGARATPSIDGDRVYTYGRGGDLACWGLLDGKPIWRGNVTKDGGEGPRWGFASSPLVYEDKVIVQAGGQARAIACDKMTGKVAWKSPPGPAGYATVRAMKVGQRTDLLMFHAGGLAGLDPASGAQRWEIPWETEYGVNAATPAVAGDIVFISSDYGKGCAAVKVTAEGAKVLWENKAIQSHHSDAVILDGYVYGYSGKSDNNRAGRFKCLELATGKEMWGTGEIGVGSVLYVDGHLLCLDVKGNLFLVAPSPEGFKKAAEFPEAIPDVRKEAWTPPVVANGKLYLRYRQTLICYELTE